MYGADIVVTVFRSDWSTSECTAHIIQLLTELENETETVDSWIMWETMPDYTREHRS